MGDIVIDSEFVKYLASLGVGGIIAGMMFHWYRKDVAMYTAQWKGQSEALMSVVRENTAALTKMVTLLDALHQRMDSE